MEGMSEGTRHGAHQFTTRTLASCAAQIRPGWSWLQNCATEVNLDQSYRFHSFPCAPPYPHEWSGGDAHSEH